MLQEELDKITNIKDAQMKFETKAITVEEFYTIIEKLGGKVTFWNAKAEENPLTVNNEGSRSNGFKYNPYHHPKGKFYQGVIKKTIISLITMIHKWTTEKYNQNQFVYDDPRLAALDDFTKAYINLNFTVYKDYKDKFMPQIVDIIHGTISKEDIYYRARYFDFINQLIEQFPKGIQLTKEERENLNKWH